MQHHQYIKEYKVGHRAIKRDQNARASFVLIVGVGLMIASDDDCLRGDSLREDQQSTFTFA